MMLLSRCGSIARASTRPPNDGWIRRVRAGAVAFAEMAFQGSPTTSAAFKPPKPNDVESTRR